ncbi:MAG: hypothetical protein SFW67_35600 [Myxococcaceae bacterium]|nr:hypothetical protein [Myxococcaceae bacterium]
MAKTAAERQKAYRERKRQERDWTPRVKAVQVKQAPSGALVPTTERVMVRGHDFVAVARSQMREEGWPLVWARWMDIMRGVPEDVEVEGVVVQMKPTLEQVQRAMDWWAKYCLPQLSAVQVQDITPTAPTGSAGLKELLAQTESPEERRAVVRALLAAAAGLPRPQEAEQVAPG